VSALLHDKYAAFILPAYAISAAVFIWMIADTFLRVRRWRRRVEKLEADRKP
jgi:heme exporter protein D